MSESKGRAVIRDLVRDEICDRDLQASVLLPFFALAHWVEYLGGQVPSECGYRGGPLNRTRPPDSDDPFAWAIGYGHRHGEISVADMAYWCRVLSRYFEVFVPEDRKY